MREVTSGLEPVVLQPRDLRARRQFLAWTGWLVALLVLLLVRCLWTVSSAGDAWLRCLFVGGVAWLWLVRILAGLDRFCAQPFSASAKVLGLAAVFPFFWLDFARTLPGLGTTMLGLLSFAIALHRRNRSAESGVALGALVCMQPGAIWWGGWLAARSGRWSMLTAFVIAFGALGFMAYQRVPDTLEELLLRGAFPRGDDDPSVAGQIFRGAIDASSGALYGVFGILLCASAVALGRVRSPGRRTMLTGTEIASACLVTTLLGPISGSGAAVILLPAAAVAYNAWALSSGRKLRTSGRVLWALGVAGVWMAGAAPWIHPSVPSLGLLVTCASWLVLVSWPKFYPVPMAGGSVMNCGGTSG